jgi:hypothetical protein
MVTSLQLKAEIDFYLLIILLDPHLTGRLSPNSSRHGSSAWSDCSRMRKKVEGTNDVWIPSNVDQPARASQVETERRRQRTPNTRPSSSPRVSKILLLRTHSNQRADVLGRIPDINPSSRNWPRHKTASNAVQALFYFHRSALSQQSPGDVSGNHPLSFENNSSTTLVTTAKYPSFRADR